MPIAWSSVTASTPPKQFCKDPKVLLAALLLNTFTQWTQVLSSEMLLLKSGRKIWRGCYSGIKKVLPSAVRLLILQSSHGTLLLH